MKFKFKFEALCIEDYMEDEDVYIKEGQIYTIVTTDFRHYKVKSDVLKSNGKQSIMHISPDFICNDLFEYFKLEEPIPVPLEMLVARGRQ